MFERRRGVVAKKKFYKCDICPKIYSTNRNLHNHKIKGDAKKMSQTLLTTTTFRLKFQHFCLICQKKTH